MKYERFLRKRMNSNPKKGPIHFRAPSRIFWRTVRGCVPDLLIISTSDAGHDGIYMPCHHKPCKEVERPKPLSAFVFLALGAGLRGAVVWLQNGAAQDKARCSSSGEAEDL